MLKRIFSSRGEIKSFIHEQKDEFLKIKTSEFWYKLGFFADVTQNLNIL